MCVSVALFLCASPKLALILSRSSDHEWMSSFGSHPLVLRSNTLKCDLH